jgi:hypothetical protein
MYAALNTAIASAKDWDAFTYINDDDLLLPGFGIVAQALAKHRAERMMVYGRIRLIDSEGRRLGVIPVCPWPALNRLLYSQRIEPVYQQGTLMSRAAFEFLGGFDESLKLCADTELLARACMRGVQSVCATRREVAAFRFRAGQLSKNRVTVAAELAEIYGRLRWPARRLSYRHHAARLLFRAANLDAYLQRLGRHGWISFGKMFETAE